MSFSDEFGDYAGDEQKTIQLMLESCFNCGDEWNVRCQDLGHEPLLTERDLEWEVCGTCHGRGTSSLYLGSYSSEEWWEQDDEFRDDYMSGRYDKPCPECGGRTTVRVVSEDAKHKDRIDEWFRDMYDTRAIERAERRAGC